MSRADVRTRRREAQRRRRIGAALTGAWLVTTTLALLAGGWFCFCGVVSATYGDWQTAGFCALLSFLAFFFAWYFISD